MDHRYIGMYPHLLRRETRPLSKEDLSAKAAPLTPLNGVAELLRRFSGSGERVFNPKRCFQREYRASLIEGDFDPETRMGQLGADEFRYEQDQIVKVLDELWDDVAGEAPSHVNPETLLARILERDGYLLGRADDVAQIAWLDHPLTLAVFGCEHYLHEPDTYPCYVDRRLNLSNAPSTPEHVISICATMFADKEVVANPLTLVRANDDARLPSFASDGERARSLPQLEALSTRLWKMATSVSVTTLMARMMLQPDGGAADLDVIEDLAELFGVDRPEQEACLPGTEPDRATYIEQLLADASDVL